MCDSYFVLHTAVCLSSWQLQIYKLRAVTWMYVKPKVNYQWEWSPDSQACILSTFFSFLNFTISFFFFTWSHLMGVQVSMPWPRAISLTPSNRQFLTPFLLITLHPSCPTNTFQHMKEANHRCDLPLITSDPPNTRITTSIPTAQPLNAYPPPPQLGGCFSSCRWQMRGQRVVGPPCLFLLVPAEGWNRRASLPLGVTRKKIQTWKLYWHR